jgi:hypothetical protein
MIAISIVAVWLVVSLAVGVLFGTAMRKARGDHEESATPALPAAQVRYLSKSKSGGTVAATGHHKHATKHHAAA